MKCSDSQNFIMLYYEKRISSLKSLALHRHINKCGDCRELFLAMDEVSGLDVVEYASEGFVDSVMAKVLELPAYELKSEKAATSTDWLRVMGCAYAVLLAIGFSVLYNADMSGTGIQIGGYAEALLATLAGMGTMAASYTADLFSGFGIQFLATAVSLGYILVIMIQREKTKA